MDRNCPICKRLLTETKETKHVDYTCEPPPKDHHYAERLVDNVVTSLKVRLCQDNNRIFFKIYNDLQCMDIWTIPGQKEKIRVSHLFEPDFSDLKGLFSKMKTYLLFS